MNAPRIAALAAALAFACAPGAWANRVLPPNQGGGNLAAALPATNQFYCGTGTAGAAQPCAGGGLSTGGPVNPVFGPSAALFAAPYYSCTTNKYVATTGSDSAAGTSAAPWATLQHANDSLATGGAAAGTCINVAPGTYAAGVAIDRGGNLASSTGYVVYRCTTMDACTVTDVNAGGYNGSFAWKTAQPMGGSYVIIDGFTLAAASETTFGQGIALFNGTGNYVPAVHHVWITNNVISGYGQSGVQMNEGEYFFVLHNKITSNSNAGCSAQGSGISFANLYPIDPTRTADDANTAVYGNIGASTGGPTIHNAVQFNVLYNNAITTCGSSGSAYDTDGNNIIMDTLNWANTGGTISGSSVYPYSTLINNNVTYNSGGGSVHIFNSSNVIVANNTAYNGYLDPYDNASGRGQIDSSGNATVLGASNTFINNISVAIPAVVGSCAFNTAPYAQFNAAILGGPAGSSTPADVFTNNITMGSGCYGSFGNNGEHPMFGTDAPGGVSVYSCTSNKCATNPLWVSVGGTTTGTETTPPVAANFALQAGSPAIGYGITKAYLPATSVDAGACPHSMASCP
jgi:hypothetical protein